MHFHVYASPAYLKRFGQPQTTDDIDKHRIVVFGENAPTYLKDMNWLCTAGREPGNAAHAVLSVNNVVAIRLAVEKGVGIAMLPDYIVGAEFRARDRALRLRGAELRLLLRLSGGAARIRRA